MLYVSNFNTKFQCKQQFIGAGEESLFLWGA
jgi:hypothetical protein